MKIVCIGGGPAGLYFALLMKRRSPAHDVTVVERNKPYDTFGWGVVFSDATMDNMRAHDPVTAAESQQAFNDWDDIELEFKGQRIRSGGHGFVGIGRKKLLNILQARCEQLQVKLVFETDAESDQQYPDADLIIASDGINSRIRSHYEAVFKPDIAVRPNRYIWLGTHNRIRQEAGIATIAVGAISEAVHVNSIIAAGRADLCAVARLHLDNPAWTLTEAAKIGYTPMPWPKQYLAAKSQMKSIFQRERAQLATLPAKAGSEI